MRLVLFFIFIGFQITGSSQTPDSTAIAKIKNFQNELNSHYKSKSDSPLTKKDRRKFKGHEFFEIDLDYMVLASIVLTPKSDTFGMKTTTDRKPLYRQYGVAYFTIDSVKCQLSIFQNIKYSTIEGHENSLFLLFNDQTNGIETYGGGRYIDLEKNDGNEIIIDFNLSYNPYCHYNARYSCPIPPAVNSLPVAINAGVKQYSNAKAH